MSDEDSYLVDGAYLTCNMAFTGTQLIRGVSYGIERESVKKGTTTRLSIAENKSEINGRPVATIKDCEKNVHIQPFNCNCLNLPDREEEYKAILEDEECISFGTCRQLMNLNDNWENFIKSTGYLSFSRADEKDRADGITMESILFCRHGGLITPIQSGQVETSELVLIYTAEEGATVSGKSGESDEGAKEGVPVDYGMGTYMSMYKCTYEASPDYYLVNHEDAYIDTNGLLRMRRTPGEEAEDDYYCVAMAPGFTTNAEKYCAPPENSAYMNKGHKLRVCFQDEKGTDYYMDVVVTVAKNSSDENDFYPHNNIVEFVVDGKPKDTVRDEKDNVSFDILLGGKGLSVTEVYAYKDGAMIEGSYYFEHWEERQ